MNHGLLFLAIYLAGVAGTALIYIALVIDP